MLCFANIQFCKASPCFQGKARKASYLGQLLHFCTVIETFEPINRQADVLAPWLKHGAIHNAVFKICWPYIMNYMICIRQFVST